MKINCTQVLTDFNGKPLKTKDEDGDEIKLTVGLTLSRILTNTRADTKLDSMKRYALAKKIYSSKEADLDGADYEKITELIEKDSFSNYGIIVTGQLLEILSEAKINSKK